MAKKKPKKRVSKKQAEQDFEATCGVLMSRLSQCCGIERAAMMAHTVLLHDLSMGRARLDHLTGALKLARNAVRLLELLQPNLENALIQAAALPKKRGKAE